MKPSLPLTEAVDVTAHDNRPPQEELVLGPLPTERTELQRRTSRPNTTGVSPRRVAPGASKTNRRSPKRPIFMEPSAAIRRTVEETARVTVSYGVAN